MGHPRLRRRWRGRGRRARGENLQGRRRSLLCRLHHPARHQQRIPPRRRTHRGPQARHAEPCRGRGAAADGDHRLGDVVRPARRQAPDGAGRPGHPRHRRCRRRRLDHDPAAARADRPDRDRHRVATRDPGLGARVRRPSRDRPPPAAGAASEGARPRRAGLRVLDHADRRALRRHRRADRAAGPLRPDRRPGSNSAPCR